MTGFCESLARWAAGVTIPEPARAEARLALLDTVGCMIAGWDEPQTRAARLAFGQDEIATATALVLGTAAHALDFDDYEVPGSTHPSAPILGALLGLSQRDPKPIGTLLDAYVVGYEAIVRLGETMRYAHYDAGWHATGTLGTIGAAAASARYLGLPAPAFAHALAISASLAGGLKVQFGTDTKALHAGLAARAGIEAARLAAAGAMGALAAFEGRYGFARMHHGAATDPGAVFARIGKPLGIEEHPILRKPWPSCAYTHRVIAAALALRPRVPDVAEWKRVTLRMPEPFFRVSGFLNPTSPNEARFSATYCTLAALLDGAVRPESFRPESFRHPAVQALLKRTVVDAYDPGPDLEDMSPDHPDTVTIHLAGGGAPSESIGHVPGGPARPMTASDIRTKFAACGGDEASEAAILGSDPTAPFGLGIDGGGLVLAQMPGRS